MTLRKPDDMTVMQWLTNGMNLKTVIAVIIAVLAGYYGQSTRITVIEQQTPELSRRVDEQREQMENKLDKVQYMNDQAHIETELAAIRESQDRVETILMEDAKEPSR